jgi:hypothetical protein
MTCIRRARDLGFSMADGGIHNTSAPTPPRQLTPLTEAICAVEGPETFRVRFDTDGTGRVFRMTGLYRDGRRDASLRDEEGVRPLQPAWVSC